MIAAIWTLIAGWRGALLLAAIGAGAVWHLGAVSDARHSGALSERLVWQEKQRRADIKREAERQAAQGAIDAAETMMIEAMAETAIAEADLDAALKQEKTSNDTKTGGACRAYLPDGVRDALNRIGR